MVIFDANMVLRYLLKDNQDMVEKAKLYLNSNEVLITNEVLAEVVYVLKGVYAVERNKISQILQDFLELVSCQDKAVLKLALDTYEKSNLDFVDCILYGYSSIKGIKIATFDKKLLKLLNYS